MSDINLLARQQGSIRDKARPLRIIRLVAIFFLLFTAISSVGLFILNVQSGLSELEQEEARIISNLALYQQRHAKFNAVNERVRSISTLSSRSNKIDEVIKLVGQAVPSSDFSVDSLVIDEKTILISVSSSSLLSVDSFLSALIKVAFSKKTFGKLTLDNLAYDDKSRRYNISLSAEIL
jgi:hypothetical protein